MNDTIWFAPYDIDNHPFDDRKTIHHALGIKVTGMTANSISGTMPIDERTIQPHGILHGGASVVLAESLGSIACNLTIDPEKYICVGQNVTAHHLRPGIKGFAHGTASPIHIGKKTQLWDIQITNDEGKPLCSVRLQMAVLPKPK